MRVLVALSLVALSLAGCAQEASPVLAEPTLAQPEPAPETTAQPEPAPEPEADPNPQPEPEPAPEPTAEPTPEPEADPTPELPAKDSFVVIAVVDSGINAYHEAFRRPDLVDHPSTYIPGYPETSVAIPITFGPDSVDNLAKADSAAWGQVQEGRNQFYWIPGTNIIGAQTYSPGERPILDDNGHGTGSASVAAGAKYGSCEECLIVFIEGLGAIQWALEQSWIDIVTNSYGPCAYVSCAARAPATPPFVFSSPSKTSSEAGQVVLFSAGNGHANGYVSPQLTYAHAYTGPDWIVTVGAVSPEDKNSIGGAGKPVDLASYGSNWPAAGKDATNDEITFSGTSCASPVSAGAFGKVLLEARRALGDTTGGHAGGVVAQGTPVEGSPFLDDGELTRAELYEIVTKSAAYPSALVPYWILPWSIPSTPANALHMGWGVVDGETADAGIAWMLGGKAPEEKPVAEAWMPVHSDIRQAMWGSWNGRTANPADPVLNQEDLATVFVETLAQAFPGAPRDVLERGL